MTTIVYGPGIPRDTVPHFRALADEVPNHAAITQASTYQGHSPTPDRALDIFPKTSSEGDKLARWLVRPEVMARFGIDYRIWSFNRRVGSIFNPEVAPYEREMRDRGSPTANHVDHNHVSANPTASAEPGPSTPDDDQEDDMRFLIRLKGGDSYVTDLATFKHRVTDGETFSALSATLGVIEVSKAFLATLKDV